MFKNYMQQTVDNIIEKEKDVLEIESYRIEDVDNPKKMPSIRKL